MGDYHVEIKGASLAGDAAQAADGLDHFLHKACRAGQHHRQVFGVRALGEHIVPVRQNRHLHKPAIFIGDGGIVKGVQNVQIKGFDLISPRYIDVKTCGVWQLVLNQWPVICQNLIYFPMSAIFVSVSLKDIFFEYSRIGQVHGERLLTGQPFRSYNGYKLHKEKNGFGTIYVEVKRDEKHS